MVASFQYPRAVKPHLNSEAITARLSESLGNFAQIVGD
jgi:uncharacterized protein YutD